MIRILHITTAKSWRGGERQVTNLLKSLQGYEDIENFLLCRTNSELDKRIVNKRKINHEGTIFSWINKIKQICEEHTIDIIHAHESKSHTNALLASILYNKIPVIVTRRVLFPVKGALSKMKYRRTKKIICISEAVKKEMNKIVKYELTEVIPSAIDIHKFEKIDNVEFDFIDKEKVKIAYVAAFTKEKDHDTFLRAAKKIVQQKSDVIFYLVGDGKLFNEIKRRIEELELTKVVKTVGFIKNINALIPQFDMLLFTSISEGLGSTILDFFLARRPVVATDSLGVRDMIKNNQTGFLCEIGNEEQLSEKVIELIENPTLSNKFTKSAHEYASKNFSLEMLGKKHYKLYKRIL